MRFQLPSFEFYHRMSPRERMLSLIIAGALLLVINLVAISTLLKSSRELSEMLASKSQELNVQNMYAQEQPLWKTRTDWLKTKQPALTNRDRAGTDLLAEIQAAARVSQVTLPTFQFVPLPPVIAGERVAKPEYQTVSISIETQSGWSALVQFMGSLQKPEGFIVFDKATLRSDASDPTHMRGAFTISKWYAGGAK